MKKSKRKCNRVPCLNHKGSENRHINTINYLVDGWHTFKEHRFLGFIPTHDTCITSLLHEGKNYIATHVFFCDVDYLSDDDVTIIKEKPYILMFMGNDDISYAMRFKTMRDALFFFDDLEEFTLDIQKKCQGYN